MDYCFHVLISVSFLAFTGVLPKISCRVTKKMAGTLAFSDRGSPGFSGTHCFSWGAPGLNNEMLRLWRYRCLLV
jgi:hypothetical protein